jgi:hypothetical protein
VVCLPSLHAFRTIPTFFASMSQKPRDADAIVVLVNACTGVARGAERTRSTYGTRAAVSARPARHLSWLQRVSFSSRRYLRVPLGWIPLVCQPSAGAAGWFTPYIRNITMRLFNRFVTFFCAVLLASLLGCASTPTHEGIWRVF